MTRPTYEISDDPARVDADVVWEYLSTQAYWGRWRTREIVDRQIAASWRVVGAYTEPDGQMVGFARAISDGVALAYLADVFVVPRHQGHGIGTRLVTAMIDEGPGASFRWMLHTVTAHGLYRPVGFRPPDETYMERPAADSGAVPVAPSSS